ncbi:polymeric immunoglobulin receptor-like isoform X2 [Silurus meridionalis]|nr:polymeric immunoglobulin receptor-like isoform X2 [Silurus meridionalis]
MWVTSGRFSLFDDTKSAEFRVMIREITVEDTGTYQCGVDISWGNDIYTPVELKVKEGSSGSREVSAYAGEGVNIKCRYEDTYKDKPKSFCKIGTHQWCFTQITTKLNSEWTHNGKFSIHDNRRAGYFSVFIRELIMKDTGKYSCAVSVFEEIETYTVVKLNVGEDLSYDKSINKTVQVGGDLNISCKYPQSLKNQHKFFCKGLQPAACVYKESVTESRKDVHFGKFSLYDDRTEQIFTVSIRNVAKTDSGEFWCGAEAAWTSDHGYKVYFTQINLTVTDSSVPALTSKQPSPLLSSSITSSSTSTLTSPLSSSSSSPTTPSSSSSSAAGFSASTVITVFVILLLFLIGISVLTMILRKRHQIKATSTARGSVQNAGNNNGVPLDDCNYEEIKNITQCPALDTDTSTVYSTAHLPTNPSDPSQTVYANHDLPSIPCDSGVYSNAQLPRKPEQDIYSTVQLPTSREAEKSTQGPIYATVSFHTKSTRSNDAVAKISFNKVGVSCDYDMVSNLPSSG